MTLQAITNQLLGNLSVQAKVLTNPDSEEFQQLILRWSDIDRKAPGATVDLPIPIFHDIPDCNSGFIWGCSGCRDFLSTTHIPWAIFNLQERPVPKN